MDLPDAENADSRCVNGPAIPGAPEMPAFSVSGPRPSPLPILLAVPHAGRSYPEPLVARLRDPRAVAARLEDRYVDKLAVEVQRRTGVMLVVAHAPRALIDLNRAPDDVDWDMIAAAPEAALARKGTGRRWRSGLGLIPRRLPGLGEMWKARHDEVELRARIEQVHQPYHAALAGALATLRDRWGAVLLIDLHSMPPLPAVSGHRPAEFVIGDRFRTTCDGALIASCFDYFARQGRRAAHNRPYAGDYVLHRQAAPGRGIHAIQLEIDRRCYLDSELAELGEGFAATVDLLTNLVRLMGDAVAESGRGEAPNRWPEAAE